MAELEDRVGSPAPAEAGQTADSRVSARAFSRRAVGTYATNVAVACMSMISVVITSTLLGADGRGRIAFLTTSALLTAHGSAIGIGPAAMFLAGRDPANSRIIAGTVLVLATIFGGAATLVLLLVFRFVPAEALTTTPLLVKVALSVIAPALILQVGLLHLAQAHYRFFTTNIAWVLPPVVNVLGNGFLALTGTLTVDAAVLMWAGGQALSTLVLLGDVIHSIGLGTPTLRMARDLLRFGAQSHVARLLLIGNYRLDQWILGVIAGNSVLGVYSVAVAWAEALFFLPTALASVQRPDLVRLRGADAGRFAARVFRISTTVTLPLVVVMVGLAPLLAVGVFGSEFEGSIVPIRILAFGAFGIGAMKLIGNSLNAQGRPLLESVAVGASFVTVTVLDVILVPRFGAVGAALASAIAYTFGGAVAIGLFLRVLSVGTGELRPRLRTDLRWLTSRLSAL